MQPVKSVSIYYSYAHEDQPFLTELEKHLSILKRTGAIKTWSSQDILAGEEWEKEIARHLNEADIILLLVSSDFLASDYCYFEAQRALEQSDRRLVRVIPILLRPAPWDDAPFGRLQSLPRNGRPISSHASRGEVFTEIAREIRGVVESIRNSSITEIHWVDEAQRHYQAHRYGDALAAYEQAIKLESANSEAWLGKGESLRELQRYEEALVAYEQAMRINPNTLQAYVGRGVASYNLNRFHEALSSYEQAIALDPAVVNAHLRKSDVLYYLKRYEEALVGYQRAIQLDSKNVDAYVGMGNSFAQLQQYEQALRSYQNALPLVSAPEEALLCFCIGNMQVCLKHYEDAITFYSRAIAVDPRNIEAYLGQGKVLTELGRIEEALLDYERVLMLEPANAEAHRAKAALLSLQGRSEDAEAALERSS